MEQHNGDNCGDNSNASFFRRFQRTLLYTPLRDLLRGRLSGAMSPEQIARDRNLPDDLVRLVRSIVRRTWLRRGERIAVAHELSNRFAAQLAAGDTVEQIIERLGKRRRFVRRLRRQKKRERHVLDWLASRIGNTGIVAVALLWVFLFVRFHQGEVVIAHDYLAMLNATALNAPPDERAWPHLRGAILELRDTLPDQFAKDPCAILPEDEAWPDVVASLERSRDTLDRIRNAAAMPYLGNVAIHGIHEADRELWPEKYDKAQQNPAEYLNMSVLFTLDTPYSGELRRLSRVLRADARRAATAGDGATVLDNINACNNLARLTIEIPTLINQLVALSIRQGAVYLVFELIDQRPEALTDDQLVELQDALLAADQGVPRISFETERWSMLDSIQRAYTDDGAGGGHFVGPIFEYQTGGGWVYDSWFGSTMGYAWSFMSPGRREVERRINQFFDEADAIADLPMWERDAYTEDDTFDPFGFGWRWRFSYAGLMFDLLAPAFGRVSINSERHILDRDAAVTVVALEQFRRSEGRWPEALDELVPEYLDTIPIDRFDGKPLRYINRGSDKPLLYSIGANLKDDDGVAALDRDGFPSNAKISRWIAPSKMRAIKDGTYVDDRDEWTRKVSPIENILPPDADFILWPPLPEKPVEPDPDPWE